MKKAILTNLLFIVITLHLHSQPPWVRISPNPIESSLEEITRIPGTDRLMAIGDGASLLYTDDMGENWHVKYQPAGISRFINFNAIHFVDSNVGYLAGTKSTLLKTTDGGMTWEDVSPQGDKDLYDVYFHDELYGTITKSHSVMKTEDGCQTWDSISSTIIAYPHNLQYINDTIGFFNNGPANFFCKTINGGESWDSISINPAIDQFETSDLLFLTDSIGFISGSAYYGSHSDKFILKTYNGGKSWTQVYFHGSNFVHDIYFHNSDTGFAVGPRIMYDNVMLMTTDGGENWEECEMPYSSWNLNSIVFSDEGIGLCVGDHGQIFSSYDWGNNWIKTDDHLTILRSVNDAQVIGDSLVYIGGTSYGGIQGSVYKSINSGQSWSRVYNGNEITSINFINPELGFACGPGYGVVYKTNNGGQSWATIEIDFLGFNPECVLFINEQIGFIGGDENNYGYFKTIDGGETWYHPEENSINGFHDIAFSDDSTGFAIFSDIDYLARTYDQGETWEYAPLGYNNSFNRIAFQSSDIGFIIGRSLILKTIDGGDNWYEISSGISGYPRFNDIDFPSENIGYITIENNETQVIKTTDGGETWFPIDFPCTATPTTVSFFNEDEGLIMGDGGMIFKTYSGGIVDVPQFPADIKNQSHLFIYPNPVNNMINIVLNPEDESYPDLLLVYDNYGRIIEKIENPEKEEINIDVSGWNNGLYIIISVTHGRSNRTGKFVKIE